MSKNLVGPKATEMVPAADSAELVKKSKPLIAKVNMHLPTGGVLVQGEEAHLDKEDLKFLKDIWGAQVSRFVE